MKKCTCGSNRFDTLLSVRAVVSQLRPNSQLQVVDYPNGPIADGEITGDLVCQNCHRCYRSIADIPNQEG